MQAVPAGDYAIAAGSASTYQTFCMKRSLVIAFIFTVALAHAQTDSINFPYTAYPKYLAILSWNSATSREVKAVIDSMGLITQKAYPYCGFYSANDTNTFIVRKADSSDFEPADCRELAYLRKRFDRMAAVGPLLGLAAYSSEDSIPWICFPLSTQVEAGIIPGTTKEQLEAAAGKYGLKIIGPVPYASSSIFLLQAEAATGTAMIDIAQKLRRTGIINYVNLPVESMVCPD